MPPKPPFGNGSRWYSASAVLLQAEQTRLSPPTGIVGTFIGIYVLMIAGLYAESALNASLRGDERLWLDILAKKSGTVRQVKLVGAIMQRGHHYLVDVLWVVCQLQALKIPNVPKPRRLLTPLFRQRHGRGCSCWASGVGATGYGSIFLTCSLSLCIVLAKVGNRFAAMNVFYSSSIFFGFFWLVGHLEKTVDVNLELSTSGREILTPKKFANLVDVSLKRAISLTTNFHYKKKKKLKKLYLAIRFHQKQYGLTCQIFI